MKHLIYIIASCMILSSCSNGKPHNGKPDDAAVDTEKPHGKYIYVDDSGCIHTKLDCIVFLLDSSNYAVKRYAVSDSEPAAQLRYCSRCVSDEEYDQLTNTGNAESAPNDTITNKNY